MSNQRIAIGYTRVSTAEQAKEGLSLGVQEQRIQLHCQAHGWEFLALHSDPGRSGRKLAGRPGLETALNDVSECHGVLVVYSLSRLARSVIDAHQIARRLEEAGADLASVTEPIDTSTAMGRAFFGLLAIFAQLESDQTSERVAAVNAATVEELGYRTAGSKCYGEQIVERQLRQRPDEMATIDTILDMRERGGSLREIADALNRRKVPTPARGRGYAIGSADAVWTGQTVWRIVRRHRPDLSCLLDAQTSRRRDHQWTDDQRELLGTMTDSEVAELLDLNRITVYRERRRLGISPHQSL